MNAGEPLITLGLLLHVTAGIRTRLMSRVAVLLVAKTRKKKTVGKSDVDTHHISVYPSTLPSLPTTTLSAQPINRAHHG